LTKELLDNAIKHGIPDKVYEFLLAMVTIAAEVVVEFLTQGRAKDTRAGGETTFQ